jgi:hypothetical protein
MVTEFDGWVYRRWNLQVRSSSILGRDRAPRGSHLAPNQLGSAQSVAHSFLLLAIAVAQAVVCCRLRISIHALYGAAVGFTCFKKKSSIGANAGSATPTWLPPGTST